jgi:diaminopimelate decarboxylase
MSHPANPAASSFPVSEGCIEVGGIKLTRLADRVGQTPFYVYDRHHIDDRVAHLRAILPREIRLHYAIKANPMPAIVQHLSRLVDGFDVASAQEMKVALDTTMAPQRVSFAGPGKSSAELAQALAAGVVVEIESPRELRDVARLTELSGRDARVAIRINPDFEVKGSGMRMGGGPQQFGVDIEQVPILMREAAELALKVIGLHVFGGSQNLRADVLRDVQERTVDMVLSVTDRAIDPIEFINLGGGFGIPYFENDRPLDIRPIGEGLTRLIESRIRPSLPRAEVIIELGRYIVGEAGLYVTKIVDRKVSRGQVFLVTDGGLHHQLAASGNFGQVIRRNYPVAIGNRMNTVETEIVDIVGCLCTPLDLLAAKVELPRSEIGDLVVIFQSGAYGLTASPVNFLSHALPSEILV